MFYVLGLVLGLREIHAQLVLNEKSPKSQIWTALSISFNCMSMLMIALSGTVDEVVIPLNIQLSSGGILGNVFA